ncbi:hypothetical protein CXQ81_20475 [Pseudomonas sp. 09C 129]|uniref:hypothetical protein n=1 Tax=Pseudomonas TaxID=286 RepID=UPI000C6D2A7C|nr:MULTISPECIES: hypothetical protein [Pseudomonas]AUG02884.1 hypothetical protein CXQ81_20475 [Pseudomonas sp. 09C 129]WDH20537.1 hypothetical protein PUP50_21285 [Pseudomonas chlororaphis]
MRSLLTLCALSLLAGCSIEQQVTPVESTLVAGVHPGFAEANRDAMQANGLQIEVLPTGTPQVDEAAK